MSPKKGKEESLDRNLEMNALARDGSLRQVQEYEAGKTEAVKDAQRASQDKGSPNINQPLLNTEAPENKLKFARKLTPYEKILKTAAAEAQIFNR